MNKKETRFAPQGLELRIKRNKDGDPKICGHAAVFNSPTEVWHGFFEQIHPEAFDRALSEGQDVRGLFNHNDDLVLGRSSAGTLELKTDEVGLYMSITPPDTQMARDLMASIERGDISGQSFCFICRKEEWEEKDDGTTLRTIKDVDLFDVGPVTFPAYPDTDVALRSHEAWQKNKTENKSGAEAPGQTKPQPPTPDMGMLRKKIELNQKIVELEK